MDGAAAVQSVLPNSEPELESQGCGTVDPFHFVKAASLEHGTWSARIVSSMLPLRLLISPEPLGPLCPASVRVSASKSSPTKIGETHPSLMPARSATQPLTPQVTLLTASPTQLLSPLPISS